MEKDAFNAETRKKNREQRRARFIAMLGGRCKGCGSIENLQFDHINKNEKKLDIAHSIDANEEVLLDEIKKCQLLCPDCHLKKTKENWDWGVPKPQHGTIWYYKKYKCRCDECKKAMSEYYYSRKLSQAIDIFEKLAHKVKSRLES